MLQFEWDEQKNKINRKKHGVWFEEALPVFDDTAAIRYFDREHSENEDRFILLGKGSAERILVVVHCERDLDLIRIISVRKATKREVRVYEEGI